MANLINAGIVPFTFANADDYDKIDQGDELVIEDIKNSILNKRDITLKNITKNESYPLAYEFSERQTDMIIAGGLLNYTREKV